MYVYVTSLQIVLLDYDGTRAGDHSTVLQLLYSVSVTLLTQSEATPHLKHTGPTERIDGCLGKHGTSLAPEKALA